MKPSSPPEALAALLRRARRIAVLSGAGMSAESGIPTFRDALTGLWARFDAHALATPEAFARDPDMVWAWYESRRRQVARAMPNAGHRALAQLAARPDLQALTIVTQNVDDLHERAGSADVIHLHGSLFAPRCFDCAAPFVAASPDADAAPGDEEPTRLAPPRCTRCGGRVRPGVVWFGEVLPEGPWCRAVAAVDAADLLLVVGTSGVVYPAAGLVHATRQRDCPVVVINPDRDAADGTDLCWPVSAAIGLPGLVASLQRDQTGNSR